MISIQFIYSIITPDEPKRVTIQKARAEFIISKVLLKAEDENFSDEEFEDTQQAEINQAQKQKKNNCCDCFSSCLGIATLPKSSGKNKKLSKRGKNMEDFPLSNIKHSTPAPITAAEAEEKAREEHEEEKEKEQEASAVVAETTGDTAQSYHQVQTNETNDSDDDESAKKKTDSAAVEDVVLQEN